MDCRQTIIDLYNKNSRTYIRAIKKDAELTQWVLDNAVGTSESFSALVYSAVYHKSLQCQHNNTLQYKQFNADLGFCGRAATCACARESVAEKVAHAKQNIAQHTQQQINEKRSNTNLKKYGVANAGQTTLAKQQHADYYAARAQPKKPKQTLLEQSYTKLVKKLLSYNIEMQTPVQQYIGVSNQTYYDFSCITCNHIWSTYLDNGHIPVCKQCNPVPLTRPTSLAEQAVAEYVKSLGITVLTNDKTIIRPQELDIVCPQQKIAIEYCGLYWHCELYRPLDYHYKKMLAARAASYKLITIFEDEWLFKQDIVKARLSHIFGKSNRIYARNCTVAEVDTATAKEFFNSTHIQGFRPATTYTALLHNNTPVMMMSWEQSRYDATATVELLQMSSTHAVVGGASKLLSYYVKTRNPVKIVSYCDLRWGTGAVYTSIGMQLDRDASGAGYAYTNFVERRYRSNFTNKHSDKTEKQLAHDKKWYAIGDCGTAKYTLQLFDK